MSCPCISNQIFSTASMAISYGLPSIGMRLANLLNKVEAKNKAKIENLQKINNNISNSNGGNNSSNGAKSGGNNKSNGGHNGSNGRGNNGAKDDCHKNNKLKKIMKKIPQRLLNEGGNVNINLFIKKEKGKKWFKEEGGYKIDKDMVGHGGKIWKLLDKKGKRICSLDINGKILSK